MTRQSKVFVPVSVGDAAKLEAGKLLKVFKEYEQGGSTLYGFAEEKENVYVLTEQEIEEYRTSLKVLKTMLRTADLQLGVEATEYLLEKLQLKTNPNTENK